LPKKSVMDSQSEDIQKLVNDFSEDALKKVEQLTKDIKPKLGSLPTLDPRSSLNMKAASYGQKAKKKVPVRIIASDSLGAAPLPEGYTAAIQARKPVAVAEAPMSHHERARIVEESRPYVAPKKVKPGKSIVRAGGGEVWADPTLVHWDDGMIAGLILILDDYRLFAGDLGNEVTDELLAKAFSKYPSLLRTHVVRDKKTNKSKGFGFISFKDPDDYVKAMREMNGKYVGHRPITLKRSQWKDRNASEEMVKQQKELAAIAGNKIKGIPN
jgi:hypothetical protein